jgi:rhodanese-related sulfurtransferase
MPNPYGAPEISVLDLKKKLEEAKQNGGQAPLLLDVREPNELLQAAIRSEAVALAPLSQLAKLGVGALPVAAQEKEGELVILCHHGMRSAQVTSWLRQQGWSNVVSLAGGIDSWARQVDRSTGIY